MKHKMRITLKIMVLCFTLATGSNIWAQCFQVDYQNGSTLNGSNNATTDPRDNTPAKIPVGNLHLYNDAIQPIGSKISEISVAATEYKVKNVTPETILWRCSAASDLSYIKFLVATNGDDGVGGRDLVAAANVGGEPNVYYTWFRGIGIRQTMAGIALTQIWQSIPVTAYDTGSYTGSISTPTQCPTGWYCIRLKHIPNLNVELFKVNGTPSSGSWCSSIASSGNYNCAQPAAYIQLADEQNGNSSNANNPVRFGHDREGENSNGKYDFFGDRNGLAYSLFNAARLIPATQSCAATTANTQTVNFPTAAASNLNSGGEVAQDFQIYIQCTGNVTAGLSSGQFAVGIQASQAAYNQAQALSLVNANQGVSALVSDDYSSNATRAKNVGIFLYKDGGSTPMNFIGQPGRTGSGFPNTTNTNDAPTNGSITRYDCNWSNPIIAGTGNQGPNICYLGNAFAFPSGNNAGWYSFPILTQTSGTNTRTIPLRAVLKKLPTGVVTAGTVHATAYVLVKMQ